jgi:hypothetical protein
MNALLVALALVLGQAKIVNSGTDLGRPWTVNLDAGATCSATGAGATRTATCTFGGGGSSTSVQSASLTTSSVTPQNLVGLAWGMEANRTYVFNCTVAHKNVAGSTRVRFNLNGPAAPTLVSFRWRMTIGNGATGEIIDGTSNAFSASPQTASGIDATIPALSSVFNGFIVNGANAGTAQFMASSSVAGINVTAYAGSFCVVVVAP